MSNHNNQSNVASDSRIAIINKRYPKPGLFNSKKIAEELLQDRDAFVQMVQDFGMADFLSIQDEIVKRSNYKRHLDNEVNNSRNQLNAIQEKINESYQVLELREFGLYDYSHPAKDSVALANELKIIRERIKLNVQGGKAATAAANFTFNGSAKEGNKFTEDMKKIMLRAYNNEAENAVKSVKSEKSQAAVNRLEKAKTQIEKLGSMVNLQINENFHRARIREIELAFEHFKIVKIEKEQAKEEAAQLREEKKVEQEFKERQKLLEKELIQKQTAITKMKDELLKDNPSVTIEEIQLLESEVGTIETSIIEAADRAANLKAGYVYVISNLGSFGEGKVKIGMTRRIDPMERVKELGDASVPFGFDVHLLHYSENAVDIENQLHKIFSNKRVNLVNRRREHFYATPEEVKREVLKLDGSIAEFNEEFESADYIESENIRKQLVS